MAAAFMAYSGLSGGPSVSVDIADSDRLGVASPDAEAGIREAALAIVEPDLLPASEQVEVSVPIEVTQVHGPRWVAHREVSSLVWEVAGPVVERD